jgi:ADP-heptose:LPS heptosyltransferase
MNVKKMLKKEAQSLPAEVAARTDGRNIGIVVQFDNDNFHTILPDNDVIARRLASELAGSIGVVPPPLAVASPDISSEGKPPESIIFKNRQAIGDILCMTAAVRDFKKTFPKTRVGVRSTAMHLWDHNPNVDHQFRDDNFIKDIGPGFGTNRSNAWNIHLIDAFRIDMENKLNIKIEKGEVRPDIWMTEEEYARPPILEGPYWVIIVGGEPGWTAKQYNRWQPVVDILKDKIQIVQLGVKGQPWPALDGVTNLIGRTEDRNTGIRDLFNIFLHSQGSIGLVSMHMHLSAAFGNPCVVIAGAREPSWFTHYFGHQYLQTNGTMHCGLHTACWKCDVTACRNKVANPKSQVLGLQVPMCIDIIEPEEVSAAVMKYYRGGRLVLGEKIPNSFFKNIVKKPSLYVVPTATTDDQAYADSIGMKFGGGALTDRDWVFIKATMEKYKVKTVLEFGAGLSTLMISRVAEKVVSFETTPGWIKKITNLADPSKVEINQWDGITIGGFCGPNFDMAFVDGPSGGQSREFSTKIASMLANVVVIHDAGRVPERQWQATYLEPEFSMTSKGGHRCHLWVRKSLEKVHQQFQQLVLPVQTADGPPMTAIMLTTCRGYGGSERSSIQIMKMLQAEGYEVFLAPTGNISGEYSQNIPLGVKPMVWEKLKEAEVDLLVLYASDTIWNYKQEQYVGTLPFVKAARKVMVLNYQLGGAGVVDWTKGWDSYMFLNSTREKEFLKVLPGSKTKVLAPPTDLNKFFDVQPNYNDNIRLIRHSSQGDAKHPEYTNEMMIEILQQVPDAEFFFMPARSDCMDYKQVHKFPKNKPPVWDFLAYGNCFFYHLPPGYQDAGPRVILEAMAAGLPVIADNRYGAKDRVTTETGWLIEGQEEIAPLIKEIALDFSVLERKGKAARERAKQEFVADRWLDAIVGRP